MNYVWLILCILSAVGYGIQYFLIAKFVNTPEEGGYNLNAPAVEAIQHLIGLVFLAVLLFIPLPLGLGDNRIPDFVKSFKTLYIIPVAIIIALFMYFADSIAGEAYNLSPNASYPQAITNLYMLISTLLPVFIFKIPISLKQIFGIILALFSLFLINKTVDEKPKKRKIYKSNENPTSSTIVVGNK